MPIARDRLVSTGTRLWRWLRWPLRSLGTLLLITLLVVLAWVLSNLSDVPAQPRPAALTVAPSILPDARNAAWALMGLDAASDRDPVHVGRASWQDEIARASQPPPLSEGELTAYRLADRELTGERLIKRFEGASGACVGHVGDCVAVWLANPDMLAAQRAPLAAYGQRCEKLLDTGFEFEEPLPPLAAALRAVASHGPNASACATWLRSGAMLAAAKGLRNNMLAQLTRNDRLWRGLLQGSHTLLAHMVAMRLASDQFDTIAALAVHDAALAAALRLLMAPPPEPVAAIRHWVAAESRVQQAALAELRSWLSAADVPGQPPTSVLWQGMESVQQWLCRHRIGLHPERTLQRADAIWLALLASLDRGLEGHLRPQITASGADTASIWLPWRNTIGAILVDLGAASYSPYLARHADLGLQCAAVTLAVSAQSERVPATQRAAWAERQNLPAALRERLAWADDGRTMTVRGWRADLAVPGADSHRDAIQVRWPPD